MIKFKSVRYKNFLSTGNQITEISLDASRTTLMIGTNGAGKSTMMDAISFGLFGKPFRKIKLGQLVNSINKKNCLVEVEFETGGKSYIIKRQLKPNKFEIYVDGKMSDQNASARDQQDFLERYILKMNEKSFRQIVVLGSGSYVPFMRLSASDRRSIIEELLDIQIFSIMNDLVKGRLSDNKNQLVEVTHKIELLERSIDLQEQHLEAIKTDKTAVIKSKKNEIKRSKAQIESLNEQITTLNGTVGDYTKKKQKRKDLSSFQAQFKSRKNHLNKQINIIQTKDECPACKQGIDHTHRESVTCSLNEQSDELSTALKQIDDQMDEVNDRITNIEQTLLKITNHQNSISGINTYISRLQQDIEDALNGEVDEINSEGLAGERVLLDQTNASKYSLYEQSHNLSSVQNLLKDSGVKQVIVKNYLPVINQLINKYLTALNFFINFELDEGFNETIKSRGRDKFAYGSFSEGEKMRIDLALLFTWREVARLKSSVSTNLLILDEIFDGSLDNTGIEDFLGILNTCEDEINAFVISHKGDSILDKFGRVVQIEKHQNFSKIIVN